MSAPPPLNHCLRALRHPLARLSRLGPALAMGAWCVALACGFRVLVNYELEAGSTGTTPPRWVEGTAVEFDPTKANLVMFAHPQCPCSRASMAELAAIVTRAGGDLRVTVCFFDPESEPEAWTRSALWRSAAAIPGVSVVADHNGEIARRFGSATSGQVLLYDRDGRRTFSGGITAGRGHEGENRGRNLVIALARGDLCAPATTPVFGCSLSNPNSTLARTSP